MKSLKAVPITHENFRAYGFLADIAHPAEAYAMSDALPAFHRDMVLAPMANPAPIAFGSLKINRRPMEIRDMEYHSAACEVMMPLDDDMVIYAGPASNDLVEPEKLEAFLVPQGSMVVFRAGAWHGAPWPVHHETATVLICLPERTYLTDTVKYPLPEEQAISVTLV